MAAPPIVRRVDVLETRLTGLEQEFRELNQRMTAGFEDLNQRMTAGFEELNRHMRVLHEDVVSRLALVQEAVAQPRRKRRGTK